MHDTKPIACGPALIGCVLALCAAASPVLGQEKAIYPEGVDAEIEGAIQRGLGFLVRSQNRDGSWRSEGGRGEYPCAMTGLAGIAILASGSTPTRGRHWRAVRRSVEYLISKQQANGLIAAMSEENQSMYGHGFSTMYLAEVFGTEEDERRQQDLHRVLTQAVKLTAASQSSYGGWIYTPTSGGDEGSVTVTQMQALRACRNAGIVVPVETVKKAIQYIVQSANADGSIRYSLRGSSGGRPPITAAAVAVLYSAGRYDDPIATKALEYAKRTISVGGQGFGHYYYSHLYLAQALYFGGGRDWTEYYASIAKSLIRQQARDGSWTGDGVGTTYGTAIALTILQLPYAHLTIYQR
jgi:Prenyltransferase and squalene oxidase repeat